MDDRGIRILRTLLELAASLLMIWYMLPEHERRAVLMRAAQHGQTWAQSSALTISRWAIRCELAGDVDQAAAGYGLTRRLMVGPYQRAVTWYERLRG